MDELIEIPRASLPELKDLFLVDWPTYVTANYTLDNYINWMEKDASVQDYQILSLNGSWRDNGTFVVIDNNMIIFDSLDSSGETLKKALMLVDFENDMRISAYSDKWRSLKLEVIEIKGFKKFIYDLGSEFFHMPKEDSINFELAALPAYWKLEQLKSENAKIVNDNWSGSGKSSLIFFQRLIELNPSVGLFNDKGALIGWCLMREYGTIGSLHVNDCEHRKGYGSLLTKALSIQLAQRGYDSISNVIFGNEKSKNLFLKLGFKIIDTMYRTQLE